MAYIIAGNEKKDREAIITKNLPALPPPLPLVLAEISGFDELIARIEKLERIEKIEEDLSILIEEKIKSDKKILELPTKKMVDDLAQKIQLLERFHHEFPELRDIRLQQDELVKRELQTLQLKDQEKELWLKNKAEKISSLQNIQNHVLEMIDSTSSKVAKYNQYLKYYGWLAAAEFLFVLLLFGYLYYVNLRR